MHAPVPDTCKDATHWAEKWNSCANLQSCRYNLLNNYVANMVIAVDQPYRLEVSINHTLGGQTTGHDPQLLGQYSVFNITNLRISISVNDHRYTRHERAISQCFKPSLPKYRLSFSPQLHESNNKLVNGQRLPDNLR